MSKIFYQLLFAASKNQRTLCKGGGNPKRNFGVMLSGMPVRSIAKVMAVGVGDPGFLRAVQFGTVSPTARHRCDVSS